MAVERVEGVTDASFSYERGEGFVNYDPDVTTVEEIVAELQRMTGYEATPRAPSVDGEPPSDGSGAGDGEPDPDSAEALGAAR